MIDNEEDRYCQCSSTQTKKYLNSPLSPCLYNECEAGTHNCGNGDCEDTERSHKCHCHPGYRNKNGDISKTCVNFNECENVDQYCQNGKCTDGEGDYICNCFEGFTNEGGRTREDNLDSTCVPSKYNNNVQYLISIDYRR